MKTLTRDRGHSSNHFQYLIFRSNGAWAGKKQEAIIKLRQAVTFNPESSAVFKSLGNILMELDNTDEALMAYTSAITLNPQDAELQNSYGNALKDSGRFEEAMEAFKKVL